MLTRRLSVTAATSKASSVLSAWSPPLSSKGAQEAWKGNKHCSVRSAPCARAQQGTRVKFWLGGGPSSAYGTPRAGPSQGGLQPRVQPSSRSTAKTALWSRRRSCWCPRSDPKRQAKTREHLQPGRQRRKPWAASTKAKAKTGTTPSEPTGSEQDQQTEVRRVAAPLLR